MSLASHTLAQPYEEFSKILASDSVEFGCFGSSVSISGNTAVVGAIGSTADTSRISRVYVYEKDPTGNWVEGQILLAPGPGVSDWFGGSIAFEGDRCVVGSPFWDVNQGRDTVYLFERDSYGMFQLVQKLISPDSDSRTYFGSSVMIQDNEIIIGAMNSNTNENNQQYQMWAGAVYVFQSDSLNQWNFKQKIVASDRKAFATFGRKIARTDSLLIIGASHDSNGPSSPYDYSGSVYIFAKDQQGDWQEISKLKASDQAPYEHFGWSLDMDEHTLAVGVVNGNPQGSMRTGAVYIFEPDSNGQWIEKQKIVGSNIDHEDFFGLNLILQDDILLVEAEYEWGVHPSGDSTFRLGVVYVFQKDQQGIWTESQILYGPSQSNSSRFGSSMDIEGKDVLIGSPKTLIEDSTGTPLFAVGAIYGYQYCVDESGGTLFPVACNEYVSPSGIYTWTQTGTYTDVLTNSSGCDSLLTIKLAVDTVDISVSQSGLTLTANATGSSYQWLDCRRGMQPIPGATGQSHTDVHGIYAVAVTGTCTDTSVCISTYVTGLESESESQSIHMFPNPTSGPVTIQVEQVEPKLDLKVINILGELILEETILSKKELSLNLEGPPGIYFLQLRDPSGKIQSFRLVKQ
ncbi:MAG: T9SS type A sorting domain-containing protein [Bacteroidota bacterium]